MDSKYEIKLKGKRGNIDNVRLCTKDKRERAKIWFNSYNIKMDSIEMSKTWIDSQTNNLTYMATEPHLEEPGGPRIIRCRGRAAEGLIRPRRCRPSPALEVLLNHTGVLRAANYSTPTFHLWPGGGVALKTVVPAKVVVPEFLAKRLIPNTEHQGAVVLKETPPQQEGELVCEAVVGTLNVGCCGLKDEQDVRVVGLKGCW